MSSRLPFVPRSSFVLSRRRTAFAAGAVLLLLALLLGSALLVAAAEPEVRQDPVAAEPAASGVTPTSISQELKPGQSYTGTMTIQVGDAPVGKADVVLAFDLTSSMTEELNQAKASGIDIMKAIRKDLPYTWYGLASFMDYPGRYTYPGYSDTYGAAGDVPWKLNVTVREPITDVVNGINSLKLGNGQDEPEDYTRVLYELQFDSVGWRSYTKKIVVLFGDAPTHDLTFAGYNNGGDPGRDAVAGTDDDLDFENVVADTLKKGISVIAVDSGNNARSEATFRGMSVGYKTASGTGGQYYHLTDAANIPAAVVQLIKQETQKIDRLSFKVTDGYESWVQFTPPEHKDVPSGATRQSTLVITVPAGTAPGYYPFIIQVLADDAILGTTVVAITVPSTSSTTDTGFRPDHDGFRFQNTSHTLSWDMFRQYFGKNAVEYSNGEHNWAAEHYYNTDYRDVGTGGLCLGFSVTSQANYNKLSQPDAGAFAIPHYDKLYSQSSSDPLMNSIEFAHGTQMGLSLITWQSRMCESLGGSSWKWYEFLKSMIQNGTPAVLGISWSDHKTLGNGAHAMVPIRYEEPDSDTAYVYVYDSNRPGEGDHRVEFHKRTNSWSYAWPLSSNSSTPVGGTGCSVRARPLDIYLHQGIAPWNQYAGTAVATMAAIESASDRLFRASGPILLLFTDDTGRRLGWDDDGFHDEIPGASYIAPEVGPVSAPTGMYYLPAEVSYDLTIRGESAGLAAVSIWGDGFMAQVTQLEVTADTRVHAYVPPDGRTITLRDPNRPTHATLELDRGYTGEDRSVVAGGLTIKPGENLNLLLDPGSAAGGGDTIKLSTNSVTNSTFQLGLQRLGGAGQSVFGNTQGVLQANSDQTALILDWSNLTKVEVSSDVNHDGHVDMTQMLPDQSTPSAITLTADPPAIKIRGKQTDITVRVMDQFGHFARDGAVVNLSASDGLLSAYSGTTDGGLVHVKLTSGSQRGKARITATSGAATGYIDVEFFADLLNLPIITAANGSAPVGWEQGAGSAGRTVLDLAAADASCTNVYAGSDNGVLASADAGRTWWAAALPAVAEIAGQAGPAPVFDGTLAPSGSLVTAVAACPDGTVYAGSWGAGVYRSQNRGASWTRVANGLSDGWIYGLAVDPTDCNTVYATTSSSGVFKSTDGGGYWTARNAGLADLKTHKLLVAPEWPARLYVGTTTGVYVSDDRAGSWHAAAGLPAGVVQALATNPLSAGVVYVGGEFAGLYRSVNGGQTWDSPVLSGLTIRAIAANRRTPGVIYAGASSGGIYRSPDGGSTWQAYEANLGLLPIKALLWDGGSCSAVLAGTTNGVWRRGD